MADGNSNGVDVARSTEPASTNTSIVTAGADQTLCKRCTSDCADSVVVIKARGLFRECLLRSMGEYLPRDIRSFASVAEWLHESCQTRPSVVILSIGQSHLTDDLVRHELSTLAANVPEVPVVVLSDCDDLHEAIAAINHGAKGYISTTADFSVFMGTIKLVQAGGTYVPADRLLFARDLGSRDAVCAPLAAAFTTRELSVMQAIRQGKSNKTIANDLRMRESTVKVHIRRVMKKMRARNRTDVAVKSSFLVDRSS